MADELDVFIAVYTMKHDSFLHDVVSFIGSPVIFNESLLSMIV